MPLQYRLYKTIISDCDAIVRILSEKTHIVVAQFVWIDSTLAYIEDMLHLNDPFQDTLETAVSHIQRARKNLLVKQYAQCRTSVENCMEVLVQGYRPCLKLTLYCQRAAATSFVTTVYDWLVKNTCADISLVACEYAQNDESSASEELASMEKVLKDKRLCYTVQNSYEIGHELPDITFCVLQAGMLEPAFYGCRTTKASHSIRAVDYHHGQQKWRSYLWCFFHASEYSYNYFEAGTYNVITGHPMHDATFLLRQKKNIELLPSDWRKKIEGCLVLLWDFTPPGNTSRYVIPGLAMQKLTQHISLIKTLLARHPTLAVWFRPHPSAVHTFEELDREMEKHENTERLVMDLHANNEYAIMFGDAYFGIPSSLHAQFQTTGLPCLINTTMTDTDFESIFFSKHQLARHLERDVSGFVERLLSSTNEDPDDLQALDHYYLGYSDGQNCKRIYGTIKQLLLEEEGHFIATRGFQLQEDTYE